jgi:diacylglycerol kinase family enzyme
MSSPFGKAVVIADRRAGPAARDPGRLSSLIGASDIDFEIRSTGRDASPSVLARRAIEDGATFVIAVGNDETIHLVVNGMMAEGGARNPDAVLGVVPVGGSDFVRTFGLPQSTSEAATHLDGENLFDFDVGLIRCFAEGEERTRWFCNVAEAGFGGALTRGVRALPRGLGRLRTLLSFWGTLAGFTPTSSRVVLEERTYEGPVTNLVVANGQFMQVGRPVAPRAHPGDGKFDVLIAKGTKRQYVESLTKMPKGLHLPSPTIREYMAATVDIQTRVPIAVGADGLPVGETPARFELYPAALRLKI